MKKIFLVLILVLFATPAFASTWCMWDGAVSYDCQRATILGSGTELIVLESGLKVGGEGADKNVRGFYKMIYGESPPLSEGEMYLDYTESFANNNITRIKSVALNPNSPTLADSKWQKYWQMMNYVTAVREGNCSYSGYLIPESTRTLMVEAIASGKTITYEVFDEANARPAGFVRTAEQAAIVLALCLDLVEVANSKMYIDHPDTEALDDGIADQVMDCPNTLCLDAIEWGPSYIEGSTQ